MPAKRLASQRPNPSARQPLADPELRKADSDGLARYTLRLLSVFGQGLMRPKACSCLPLLWPHRWYRGCYGYRHPRESVALRRQTRIELPPLPCNSRG